MSTPRKCIVCPTKHQYTYCPKCGHDNPKETWRFTFCSENCRDIYQVTEDFVNNRISKEEAKAKLTALDLSDRPFYSAGVKSDINAILDGSVEESIPVVQSIVEPEPTPVVEVTPVVEAEPEVEQVVETVVEPVVEEVVADSETAEAEVEDISSEEDSSSTDDAISFSRRNRRNRRRSTAE